MGVTRRGRESQENEGSRKSIEGRESEAREFGGWELRGEERELFDYTEGGGEECC